MARSGSFTGTLDPFGGSRGGLGRYNVSGETIVSLAQYEAYATEVAWANGQASDEEYLASLQRMVDLANPGTRERITAENKLGDAVYSIGRNKIATQVNAADTPAERIAALRQLLAYDQQRLASMDPNNQAYRSQADRVAGVRVDIRQSQYSELINKVNANRATTGQLLALARSLEDASVGDPDHDDWQQAVVGLADRVADEELADAYQAYQHNRLSGPKLLAKIDARLAVLTAGSPQYKELARQREDLAERITDEERVKRAATMNGKRAAGTTNDAGYLAYLRDEVALLERQGKGGTAQWVEARDRLAEFTFSIAEDKLRFDVTKGRQPVSKLIAFYKSARARMDPNSERYRALTLTIDSLSRGGGSGGGTGGRAGGRAGAGVAYYEKQLVAASTLTGILGGATEPPGFKDLFRLDVRSTTSRAWWDNNMRSAVAAFQAGARTWTYYEKGGAEHQLPFSPSLMHEFDRMNLQYMRNGLAGATTVKQRQQWVGKIITATKADAARGGQYTMDVYTKTFGDIARQKESALAGARWAEYVNLTREQMELVRVILRGTLDPALSPNPYLNDEQRARIARDLATLSPLQADAALDGYNPTGDIVLQMVDDGRISVALDEDGRAIRGSLDPHAGFLTQLPADGQVTVVPFDMNVTGNSVYDPALDREVPAYMTRNAPVVIRHGGQDIEVWQPIEAGGAELPVYTARTGAASQLLWTPDPLPGARRGGVHVSWIPGPAGHVEPLTLGPNHVTVPVQAFNTREGTTIVRWVSIDGKTWTRYTPGTMTPPRVVIPAEYNYDGAKWTKNGEEVDPSEVLSRARWWGADDSRATGQAWGNGAPGMDYTMRTAHVTGPIDTRPDSAFQQRKRGGEREFDTNDPAEIRSYYFDDEAEMVETWRRSARQAEQSLADRGLDRPASVYAPGALPPSSVRWASELVPPDARQRSYLEPRSEAQLERSRLAGSRQAYGAAVPGAPAKGRPLFVTPDQFNIGIKPQPTPALPKFTAPTLSLAPVRVPPLSLVPPDARSPLPPATAAASAIKAAGAAITTAATAASAAKASAARTAWKEERDR